MTAAEGHLDQETHDLPVRCTAETLARILRDVISRPHRLVLDTDPPQLRTGSVWASFGVWRLLLSWVNGELVVQEACCPESLKPCSWWRGCERDDWGKGPAAQIIEPVAMLTSEERQQLIETIAAADVEEPIAVSGTVFPLLDQVQEKPKVRPGRSRKCLKEAWG